LIDENATLKDELYSYMKEELRNKNQELSSLKELIATRDQEILSWTEKFDNTVAELEEAVIRALDDQKKSTENLGKKIQNLEQIVDQQNEAQCQAEGVAGEKEISYDRALKEKDEVIGCLEKELQQYRTSSDAKQRAASDASWAWW
jgi:hypothetical protein